MKIKYQKIEGKKAVVQNDTMFRGFKKWSEARKFVRDFLKKNYGKYRNLLRT